MLAALYSSVKKCLHDAQLVTPEMSFAWRAFNFDYTTVNPFGLPYGQTSRPSESMSVIVNVLVSILKQKLK